MDGEVVGRRWTIGVSLGLLLLPASLLIRLSKNTMSLTDRLILRTGRLHLY